LDKKIKEERCHGHSLNIDKAQFGNEGTNDGNHSELGIDT